MEQEVIGIIIAHVWIMSCAVVGGFVICGAYWFAVTPDQRADWLPLVIVLLAVTTALVISVIKGSIALSLGLIGALSIARFRTRISDPRQLALVLVSIAVGVGFGSGETVLASVGTVFIASVIAVFYSPSPVDASSTPVPRTVAQLGFTGDAPVTISELSDFLRNRGVSFRIRSISRKANVTTVTVHLYHCALAKADHLIRDLVKCFPAHQCDCNLQVKSAAEWDFTEPHRRDAAAYSRDTVNGVEVSDGGIRRPAR